MRQPLLRACRKNAAACRRPGSAISASPPRCHGLVEEPQQRRGVPLLVEHVCRENEIERLERGRSGVPPQERRAELEAVGLGVRGDEIDCLLSPVRGQHPSTAAGGGERRKGQAASEFEHALAVEP